MTGLRITAIVLIVAGTLGLIYGGFSYSSRSNETEWGPLNVSVDKRERINIPFWVGAGSIALGAALLLIRRRS
ncbi:MAG TPA: hypothetical protein VFV64_13750 [Permianibacter sp.]|nr:hypothetical protein [Permianibacter sp.]